MSPGPRPTLLGAALAILALLGSAAHAKLPSWDKRIDGSTRFQVLKPLASDAVLDRETGLVWERSAEDEPASHPWRTWRALCLTRHTGGRLRWRLPHAHELQTLVDPATGDLPAGHPFSYFATQQIPTATLFDEANALWFTALPHEQVALNVNSLISDLAAALWYVRGPLGGTD